MIFGIDYDNTFSNAPELFQEFLDLIEKHGHKAVLITQRPKPGAIKSGQKWICHNQLWQHEVSESKQTDNAKLEENIE